MHGKNGKNKDREEVEEKAPHSITADDWDDEWDDLEDHLLIIEAAIRECFNQFKLRFLRSEDVELAESSTKDQVEWVEMISIDVWTGTAVNFSCTSRQQQLFQEDHMFFHYWNPQSILDPTRQSTSTSNVHILMYFMNLGQPGQAQQSTATSNVHILPHAMNVAYPGLEQLSSSSTSNVHIFPNVMSIHTHQCR
ncbi:hypothetical protein V6N11_022397 [Hibiscus sabdariffa]|uniref:Uncharacterized protein n=1 Tax=Hibiscus sabdariffa TaxID=183260 RepID=A0ABR2TJ13_9ROSI